MHTRATPRFGQTPMDSDCPRWEKADEEADARNDRGWTDCGDLWTAAAIMAEWAEDAALAGTFEGAMWYCDPCGKAEYKRHMWHGMTVVAGETTQCRECSDKAEREMGR